MPCVSVFVGNELMCAKFHHTHLFERISQRFSSECIQSPASLYSWLHEVSFQPLMHFLTASLFKVWFCSKDCLYKIGICRLNRYIPCVKSEYRSSDFNGKNFFPVLLFCVSGREAELQS